MKAFKTFSQCPEDKKPMSTVTPEWPWVIQDILPEHTVQWLQSGYQVMTDEDFTAYLATYQDEYDAWAITYQEYLDSTDSVKLAKIKGVREWCELLIEDVKLLNQNAGLGLSQSLWFHHRTRALPVNVLQAHADALPPLQPLVGIPLTLDLMNLVVSGDIETAYAALLCAQADDMTEDYHCISQDLLDYLKYRIATYLGWA